MGQSGASNYGGGFASSQYGQGNQSQYGQWGQGGQGNQSQYGQYGQGGQGNQSQAGQRHRRNNFYNEYGRYIVRGEGRNQYYQ